MPLTVVVDAAAIKRLVEAAHWLARVYPSPEVDALMVPVNELALNLQIASMDYTGIVPE